MGTNRNQPVMVLNPTLQVDISMMAFKYSFAEIRVRERYHLERDGFRRSPFYLEIYAHCLQTLFQSKNVFNYIIF